jgi:hypothetical protein
MARSLQVGALVGILVCTVPAVAQVKTQETIISVKEQDKPAQKCRVLKCWREKDGSKLCQVQAIDTGEIMTILESDPTPPNTMGSRVKAGLPQIFHWGSRETPPPGTPIAPPGATVLASPAPKPSFFGRLFGSSQPANGTVCTTTVQATPAPPLAKDADKATVKTDAEPPKAGDWRESWGKVERWTAEDSKKAAADAAARAEQTNRPSLPLAVKDSNDPLKQPDVYTKAGSRVSAVPQEKIISVTPVSQAQVVSSEPPPRGGLWARWTGKKAPAPAAQPVVAGGEVPLGTASWQAAGMPSVSVAAANAFTDVVPRDGGAPEAPQSAWQQGTVVMGHSPMDSQGPVPPGMANAFTQGGTTRPIPADFGPTPQLANAFPGMDPVTSQAASPSGPMMASRPMMQQPMAYPAMAYQPLAYPVMVQQAPAMAMVYEPQVGRLIAVLQQSGMPSEREMAVEEMARYDWRSQPHLVDALVMAAKADPAPSVRAGCVRALAKMKATTPPVVQAVQALRTDSDPRVRQEVEQALAVLH